MSDGVRIHKLEPDYVSKRWDTLGYFIQQALEKSENPFAGGNLLKAIQTGKLECWAVMKIKGEVADMIGVVTTKVGGDQILGTRDLVLYSVTAIRRLNLDDFLAGVKQFEEVARGLGCSGLVSYVRDRQLAEMAERIGFQTKHVVRKEL